MSFDQQLAIDFDAPTMADARAARDVGMALVADKAERDVPGFSERAFAALLAYVSQHATFTGEDCTDAIKAQGIVPDNDKAFGSVYMRAIRLRFIRRIGFEPRRKGHGSPGPRYTRCV